MRVGVEKFPERPAIHVPEQLVFKEPVTIALKAPACSPPYETLIERVVDFMDTYSEN
jgi:hypothetical protein